MKKAEIIYGLPDKCLSELEELHGLKCRAIDKKLIRTLFRQRPSAGHKGTFGHALIIAGSEGSIGAAILASKAALRCGCGLVTTSIHTAGINPLLATLPEAMTKVRNGAQDIRSLDLSMYDAIGFGPGIGITDDSTEILLYLLENYKGPLIIDADGITILSRNPNFYELLNENVILTPHPVEFSRLFVTGSTRKDVVHAQINFHKEHRCTILVKGRNTTVVSASGLFYNTSGNSGMATAGSGDVLTGIITSLCAQDYTTGDAALVGTFLHGYAADVAVRDTTMHCMIASDIIRSFPSFFKKFEIVD